MNQNLQHLYQATLFKYKKFRSRFEKNLKTGQFDLLSSKRRNLIISRLERLRKRLESLKYQIKLALASGALVFSLNAQDSKAQQLGPFVENQQKNPLRPPNGYNFNNADAAAVDIDNDGDLDVFVGSEVGLIRFFRNNGTPTEPFFEFAFGTDNPANGIDVGTNSTPTFADLDNDGDFDMIVGQRYQYQFSPFNNVRFYENTGTPESPVFTVPGGEHPVDNIFSDDYNSHPTFGDLDNDGDLDAFVGGLRNTTYNPDYRETIKFWSNDGSLPIAQFSAYEGSANPISIINPEFGGTLDRAAPTLVDIDNDNDLDLIVGDVNGNIRFFRNDGNTSSPNFATEITGGINPFDGIDLGTNASTEFADLDGDGDFDMIAGSFGYQRLRYFKNVGTANSAQFEEQFGVDNPFNGVEFNYDVAPTAVDIDGDGFLDLVIGEKYNETLHFYQNNADGTFSELSTGNPFENILDTYDSRPVPAFGDVDNDGDLDLFVSIFNNFNGPSQGSIKFFRNTGSNVFVEEASPIGFSQYYSTLSATVNDFDGDSDLDAIIGGNNLNYSGASFVFVENTGDSNTPNFVEQDPSGLPFNGIDMVSGYYDLPKPIMVDLDHDGDLDVASGIHNSLYSGQMFFFENEGGVLTRQYSIYDPFAGLDAGYDSHPAFLDVDNDGDLDIMVGNGNGTFVFFENQNESPYLVSNASIRTFTEGSTSVSLDNSITINDADNDLIISAEVSILNFVNGEDEIIFTPSANVTGSFSNGTLSLQGSATIAEYQTVLRSVRYRNTSASPNTTTRNIRFTVVDFDNTNPLLDSNAEPIVSVNVISVNSAPEITVTSTNAIYEEGATPGVPIDEALIVSDLDNTTLNGATISIIGSFTSSEDLLEFTDQNNITGSYDAATGVLTLTGVDDIANYQTALRSITYRNTSNNPNTTNRTIEFIVNDGEIDSAPGTRIVEIIPVNDSPVLSGGATNLVYQQNSEPLIIDNTILITDVDNETLANATITLGDYLSGDVLTATSSANVTVNFDTNAGILTATGVASLAEYESVLQSAAFSTNNGTGNRTIEFVVNDGSDNSNLLMIDLSITENQPPTLNSANAGTTLNYIQNDPAIAVDPLIEITDIDSENLSTLIITIGNYEAGDLLEIIAPNGTTASFDGDLGILTVSGDAPIADYQSAAQSVTFASTTGSGPKTIEFIVNDGEDNSNTYSRDIAVEVVTEPPVVNTTPATTQTGSIITIDLCTIISDPDNTFEELVIEVVSTLSGAITSIDGCDLTIDYTDLDFRGTDNIVLRATDPDGNTDENTLSIEVQAEEEPTNQPLQIYNAISPNGDGQNDWWEIVNLTTPNKILLYNRWGELVKTLTNYENIEDNTAMYDLPSGTYFYKIESPQGEYTGYLNIKK